MNNTLNVTSDSELLSYVINSTPVLKENIDLPVQGKSIEPIGKIIINNQRYRNAFINTINVIGLTLIKRNNWENPWDFTIRGTLKYGQQIRELILDLCKPNDYNANVTDTSAFLKTEVPNVLNYIHEVNFQKYYQTTTSEYQLQMAFSQEGNLLDFITLATAMLYESFKYDIYIVDKYMICRRVLDGTITPHQIVNYSTLTPRQRVSQLKSVSNLMTFRSPNYNPAGIRTATSFDNQIAIINTDFEADFSTEVLATSFFKDEADMKSRMVLVDGFSNHDSDRLSLLLGEAYTAFTADELTALSKIPAIIISKEWFMDYYYAFDNESNTKETMFFNPTTLENNHYLHAWMVFSTSPFENAVVFTSDAGAVTSVTLNPSTSTLSAGLSVQLTPTVVTTGFVNKAVTYAVDDTTKATVTSNGLVTIKPTTAKDTVITVTAKSVYDDTKTGTATITVA